MSSDATVQDFRALVLHQSPDCDFGALEKITQRFEERDVKGYLTAINAAAASTHGALTPQRVDYLFCDGRGCFPLYAAKDKIEPDPSLYLQRAGLFNQVYLGLQPAPDRKDPKLIPTLRHYFLSMVMYGEMFTEGGVQQDQREPQEQLARALIAYTGFHPEGHAAIITDTKEREICKRATHLVSTTSFRNAEHFFQVMVRLLPTATLTMIADQKKKEIGDKFFSESERKHPFFGIALDTYFKPLALENIKQRYRLS